MTKGVLTRGLLLALLLLFGLSFGLNYGNSNQVDYLLRSVQALDPTLWARDAFVQTRSYHPAYEALGTLLLRLSPSGLAIAWANVLFIALGMLAIHEVVRRLAAPGRALPAFCIVLILASITRTQGPGISYAFSEIFQPSTLGAVGMLAAAAAFVAGAPLVSGLCLAFAGCFHVNYLLLSLCVFAVGWCLADRARLLRNALLGLGPPALVLCWFLPFLLATARAQNPIAQQIYLDIRLPHHYCPRFFAWDFSFWIGAQLLAAAALIGPARRGMLFHRRALMLLVGWWMLVIPSALLSSVVVIRSVQQLFAWRVAAEAELVAQAAFAVAVTCIFCDGKVAAATYDWRAKLLGAAGLAALVLGSAVTGRWGITGAMLLLLGAGWVVSQGLVARFTSECDGLPVLAVTAVLGCILAGEESYRFWHFAQNSNLISGGDQGVSELCTWEKAHTPENALFLTPPTEEELRFQCQRAIVVDWKSNPAMPDEVLSWFDRIEDVTGRRPFRTDADLAGYDDLDTARVAALRKRYGIDYVVVERNHALNLAAPVFSNSRFLVYFVGAPGERLSATLKHSDGSG